MQRVQFIEAEGADWFQVRLDDGWLVRYRLELVRGRVVFTEMRLLHGRGVAPPDGVTPALLRAIPIGEHRRLLLDEMARSALAYLERPDHTPITLHRDMFRGAHPTADELGGLDAFAPVKAKHTRRDDRWYAELARFYAALVEAGTRRPIPTIAEQMGLSPGTVTTAVRDARAMGFLTATQPGRAGGRLTAKARRHLEREED